jgi:hypothetical protein
MVDKRLPVHQSHVDFLYYGGVDLFHRLVDVATIAEVHRQAVAGTGGDDAEYGGRIDQGRGHLVDGAVATHGYNDFVTFCYGFQRQFAGVLGPFGEAETIFKPPVIQVFVNAVVDVPLQIGACLWIDNKNDAFRAE